VATALVVVVLGLATAGCGAATGAGATTATGATTAATTPTTALPVAAPPAPLVWTPCPGGDTVQCGTVQVPVDYQRPEGAQLTIAVTRVPATDPSRRIGTLLFNPGGPAESGNQILPVVLGGFPAQVRQRFDIVTFDPRGTGASGALDCGTSPTAVTSQNPVPTTPGGVLPATGVFTAMARACRAVAPNEVPFLDSTDTARDMDRIRQALGAATVSYYGLSYGTLLGAVYAELFPHRVRAMVLDGAVDVNASLTVQAEEQAPAAEASVVHLLATCGGQAPCPLGPRPEAAFTHLAADLSTSPLPAPGGSGGDQPVTVGDLDTATLLAVSVPEFTGQYLAALVAARAGDGAPLRTLALSFVTDIDGAELVDPLWAITCNDAAAHPGPAAAGTLARALAARDPLIGGYSSTYALGGCVAWPKADQPVTDVHPVGAPPTLVIGNTGDPNTPLVGARHLAADFPRASQLTWRGWGHTWLLSGPSDACMQARVTSYLVADRLPPAGTTCP
jgi:pimeloyl-ACP methyl ester carboxylesterase